MTASARYRLPALCHAIGIGAFRAWFGAARPGEEIVYAKGVVLDGQRDVAVVARDWQGVGAVELFRRRNGEGGFDYVARRRAADVAAFSAARSGGGAIAPDSELGRVLAALSRAANFALPCPTNAELAETLALDGARGGAERARYLVGQLAERGLIRVESRGPRVTRVVTIAATGKATSRAAVRVGRGIHEERAMR